VSEPSPTLTIERLGTDVVAMAQCIAIDADAFPYPSARFAGYAPWHRVWVARDGERSRVVGFLAGHVQRSGFVVDGVAVDRHHRRRGAGRALVRHCVTSARRDRLEAVVLCVSVTNREAIELYVSEGFVVSRRLPGYYAPGVYGETRGDALQMTRAARP
jgi:ribosomal protein S18 acetylase RimI-like enzyme